MKVAIFVVGSRFFSFGAGGSSESFIIGGSLEMVREIMEQIPPML